MPDISTYPELQADYALIKETARRAGALVQDYAQGHIKSWNKAPDDPVSEADLAVNDLIQTVLLNARKDYGWFSEESKDTSDRLTKQRLWVVDPIDGTRAFLRKKPEYAVSIALLDRNIPILAALYDPCRDILYHAAKGHGAFRNTTRITVSQRTALDGARMLADKGIIAAHFWPTPWPDMDVSKPNSIALRLAMVAQGSWDAAFCVRTKSDWDLAAGALILEEAGGSLITHTGQPLDFNKPRPHHPNLIATGPGLKAELIERVTAGWHASATRQA